ncbi:hypothetical protein BTVI_77315 [Pitangus sulphuratus]|nr:hypothetical protein BTVI_77315 [Pitangus sulphuratus]
MNRVKLGWELRKPLCKVEVFAFGFKLRTPQQKLSGCSGSIALQRERNREIHEVCIPRDCIGFAQQGFGRCRVGQARGNCCTTATAVAERSGNIESHTPADPKVSEEAGEGGAPYTRADSPAAHGANHGKAAVPLQPMEVNSGAEIHPQPLEDPPHWSEWIPEGCCALIAQLESSLKDLWSHKERNPGWSRFARRACDIVGDPPWNGSCRTAAYGKDSH